MTHVVGPDESAVYDGLRERLGYVPNYARAFGWAPEVYAAWEALAGAVKRGLGEWRYELATVAAARRLGSAYCTLAHVAVLRDRYLDAEAVRALLADWRSAGLRPEDVAVLEFADRMAADPNGVTAADVAALKQHGLSEVDVCHVVLAVAARRFFTAVLAATGMVPDDHLKGYE